MRLRSSPQPRGSARLGRRLVIARDDLVELQAWANRGVNHGSRAACLGNDLREEANGFGKMLETAFPPGSGQLAIVVGHGLQLLDLERARSVAFRRRHDDLVSTG
jgi:hypothetical protein